MIFKFDKLSDKLPPNRAYVLFINDDPTEIEWGEVMYQYLDDDVFELEMYAFGRRLDDMFIDENPPPGYSKFFYVAIKSQGTNSKTLWMLTDTAYLNYNAEMGEQLFRIEKEEYDDQY